jgi:biopolymer transport protein ExbB
MGYFTDAIVLFKAGGFVMYPLLICSIIAVTIAIERYLYFRAAKTNVSVLLPQIESDLKAGSSNAALKTSENTKGFAAEMLSGVLANPHRDMHHLEQLFENEALRLTARLRSRVVYLDTIVTISPILGILGTVHGMITSFSVMNVLAGQQMTIIGGVSEALISTAAGLYVAIMALIFHSYLNHCMEEIINDMEVTANTVITAIGREVK